MTEAQGQDRIKIKIQLTCGEEVALGPGKADLLEALARDGSISAAARALGMSYRRAWMLVDTMNRCWDLPLVVTAMGGRKGGGARLSELGTSVLAHYRKLQAAVHAASLESEHAQALASALREVPRPSQHDA